MLSGLLAGKQLSSEEPAGRIEALAERAGALELLGKHHCETGTAKTAGVMTRPRNFHGPGRLTWPRRHWE